MFMSRHQNAGQSHGKTVNKCLKNVAKFKYWKRQTNKQNYIHEKIKLLNSGNDCHHLFLNRLFSRFLSKNLQIKTHQIKRIYYLLFYLCVKLDSSA